MFFRKKTDSKDIPEWASFFVQDEYSTFLKALDHYFKSLSIDYEIHDGCISVTHNKYGFDNLGLTNVAQVCKQQEKRHYKEIIREHFECLIRSNEFDREFQKIVNNFDEVKKYIGVRLYDTDYVQHIGKEATVGKDLAGDIYSMIVFDLPDSILNIKPEQITYWNKTVDELFELGVSNVKAKYPLNISKEDFAGFSIWFVQGEHFFTPNIVFDMENRPELMGSKGSLIGLPHRHSAIIYPIESLEVVQAINGLIPTIYGMNQEGPGSLSNQLFWYQDKNFTPLPYKIEDKKLQFFPPEQFLELLNGMNSASH